MQSKKLSTSLKRKLVLSLVLGLSATPMVAVAADEDVPVYNLDEVIVTATRTQEEIKKVPSSVTVVTKEQIQKENAVTITDALKKVPGVFINRPKGIAETANGISMRGFGEDSIQVLYDGMPLNEAYDGSVNWNAIPVDNVERIEIVRGAASSLYGGRAVGGVINIITKEPTAKMRVRLGLEYGTNGTWRKAVDVSQKATDKISYDVGYEQRITSGFASKVASYTSARDKKATGTVGTGLIVSQKVNGKPRYIIGDPGNGGGKNNTYHAKLKYNFDPDKSLTYAFTHDEFRYWSDNPHSYIHDAKGNALFEGSVQAPNGRWINFDESDFTDYYGRRDTNIHSLRYDDEANKITANLGVSNVSDAGYSTSYYFDGNKPGSDTKYPSTSYKLDFQKVWDNLGRHTVVAGFNIQKDDMDRTTSRLAHWHDWDSTTSVLDKTGGKDDIYAAFVQDEYRWNDQLKLYTGVRFDHYKKHGGYDHNYSKKTDTEYDETSYNQWSPKIALEYTPDDVMTYYVSYGHSFNPPTLYMLYRTDSYYDGNPDLKPEISNTYEIGFKARFDPKNDLKMSLFKADTKDLITSEYIEGSSKRHYINKEEAKRTGLELDYNHKFNDKYTGYINYQWEMAYDQDDEWIYDIPKHILHTGLRYDMNKWSANLDGEYVSNRNAPGEVDNVYLSSDPYFILNAGVGYKFNKKCSATFTVNNLLGRDYYLWYKAPGRTYTVGVQYEF